MSATSNVCLTNLSFFCVALYVCFFFACPISYAHAVYLAEMANRERVDMQLASSSSTWDKSDKIAEISKKYTDPSPLAPIPVRNEFTELPVFPDGKVDNVDKAFGTLHMRAVLTPGAPAVQQGLVWRIFPAHSSMEAGMADIVAYSKEAEPRFQLIATDYIVSVRYGLSHAVEKVSVQSQEILHTTVVLNAGGLILFAKRTDGTAIPPDQVEYDIYALDDHSGSDNDRKSIFSSAVPGKAIRLNAGNYHIVSRYGGVNSVVESDVPVRAGRLSRVEVDHAAAQVILKLVDTPGGKAIANTTWNILDQDGKILQESAGAFSKHILAEGDYMAVAYSGGRIQKINFSVQAAQDQEIELIADMYDVLGDDLP